ncbi:thioredoxin family protein [Thalassoroseus pseudoceratinae]|uniref:thioredoxin family protein n=1 Tax=Thalassoroseus pseudoceratinae TaxID=2713176 RepID=UPI001421C9A3|nr:DUF255 domain-containing protein [Thalassoroseus pseudoceratinae]
MDRRTVRAMLLAVLTVGLLSWTQIGFAQMASTAQPVTGATTVAKPVAQTMAAVPQTVQWQPNLQAAHRLSQQTGRPMLLVFGASWCHFCHKLEDETLGDPRMAAYVNSMFVPVHLDLDKDQRVAKILGVSAVPATIVLSPQAELVGRHDGFAKVVPFAQKLEHSRQTFLASQEKIQQVSHVDPTP